MPIVVVNTAVSPAMVVESAPPAQARGRLQVHAEPRDAARIYVDGFFAGSGSNEGSVFELEEGLHTIEVRADGFQDVSELVLVTAAGSVTHKVSLKAAPQPPPRSGPLTFYVVPGCYAGDVPPDRAALPASCGPARAVTVAP